ncbi:unnamed protein product [Cuscuta epithymum]|nr:unnamed protein product [Cuscuta epithymum]CAH9131704.1 unnamed protein product [Cuscuta epithymum]
MVCATAFPLEALSSLEAELMALIKATTWAIHNGYDGFQVECDADEALDYISGRKFGRWKEDIVRFREISFRKGISFRHVLREGNEPAHLLAGFSPAHLTIWTDVKLLPSPIRTAILLDFFNFPSFRWRV